MPDSRPGRDLFISYAHVDDAPVFEVKWVSTLVQDLRNLLSQKLGRAEDFSVWWDEIDLRGNHSVTPEIRTKVQQSATMLLVLSRGYLASQWCMQEKDLFFERLGGKPQGRVFVVEKHALDKDQALPAELVDIKGYRFWYRDEHEQARTLSMQEPEPHTTAYTRLVEDLANDISKQLKALAAVTPPVPDSKATVFLAEVTDDLEPRREQVRRYLEQAQLRVLPERRYLEGQAFQQVLEEDLAHSKLFIQLLGEYPSRRPPDIPQGYARLQLEQAQALQLPILQWHDPTLVLDQVESKEQRELLQAVSVYAEPLESFKQRAVQQAIPSPSPSRPPVQNSAPVVFINVERRDRVLAEAVRDQLDMPLIATLPAGDDKATSSAMREDLEHKLLDCDALIVVYGETTQSWVDKQLLHCNRIAPQRDRPLHALGVYDGPPEDKPDVSIRMPGLEILMCRRGLDAERLRAFLAPLLQAVRP